MYFRVNSSAKIQNLKFSRKKKKIKKLVPKYGEPACSMRKFDLHHLLH